MENDPAPLVHLRFRQAGDTKGAPKMYEKSLVLNPNSESGKAVLARTRTGAGSSSSESTLLPPPPFSSR